MAGRNSSGKTADHCQTDAPVCVLLVDHDPDVCQMIAQVVGDEKTRVYHADTVAEAKQLIEQNRVDLMLVEPRLPDGSGMALADHLEKKRRDARTIVITQDAELDQAIEAIRAGVVDYMVKPLDGKDLSRRVKAALKRQQSDLSTKRRVRRLKRQCKRLDSARVEVAKQVDLLCSDLVSAYQELAMQMQTVVHTSEFAAVASQELDLEQLLRKSLEYLLGKAGPTNAAIFLPATIDEFSLGGYVNYDWSSGSPDVLLQHLADAAAPVIAEHDGVLHLTDNKAMTEWMGEEATYLNDCHLVAVACCCEDEPLAVIILFRDGTSPFGHEIVETCGAVAPMLGEYLSRIIRIHHRHVPGFNDAPDETGPTKAENMLMSDMAEEGPGEDGPNYDMSFDGEEEEYDDDDEDGALPF